MMDQDLGAAARDWEGAICDLLSATGVAAFVVDQTMERDRRAGITLSEGEIERIVFITYEVHRAAKAFRDRYYEAIGSD